MDSLLRVPGIWAPGFLLFTKVILYKFGEHYCFPFLLLVLSGLEIEPRASRAIGKHSLLLSCVLDWLSCSFWKRAMFTWPIEKWERKPLYMHCFAYFKDALPLAASPFLCIHMHTGLKLARENFQPGMAAHTCNLSTSEAEAGGLPWIWGQSEPPSEFQVSQDYMVANTLSQKKGRKFQLYTRGK